MHVVLAFEGRQAAVVVIMFLGLPQAAGRSSEKLLILQSSA